MSIAELIELFGSLLLVAAVACAAAVLLPGWSWPAGLGVAGAGLLVVSALMERASRRGGS